MDLSGRSSSLGIMGRNAIQFAVEAYNETHKQKIELVIKDTTGEAEKIDPLLKEFEKEKVNTVIGPITSQSTEAIFLTRVYKEQKIVFISPTVSSSDFSGIDDCFLTLFNTSEEQGKILAETALQNKTKKIAIVNDEANKSYCNPLISEFQKTIESAGSTLVYNNSFTSSEKAPFVEIAEEVVNSDADSVLIVAGALDSAQLCQHIHKLNQNIKIYAGTWTKTDEFIENAGKAAEGAYLLSSFDEEYQGIVSFKELYKAKFGVDPSFAAIHSYDAAQILLQVIDSNIELEPHEIKEYITNTHTFKSLAGETSLDEFGDCSNPFTIVQVENGKFVKVNNYDEDKDN